MGYSNFTTTDTTDTLPIIQGDMMLPTPLSSGDVTGQGGTMVEGSSTISNLSIMSQPGSVDQIHVSPGHSLSHQDQINDNAALTGIDNYGAALAEGFFDQSRC